MVTANSFLLLLQSVFPPITASITSVNNYTWLHPMLFSAIHFLLLNIGDLLGRSIPSNPSWLISNGPRLLTLSISRVVFIPLFLLCKISPTSTPLFNSDFIFFSLVLLLGTTNGYLGSCAMIVAPSLKLNERLGGRVKDVDTAATIASFSLVAGLAVGSFASFGVRAAVCGGCNPFVS